MPSLKQVVVVWEFSQRRTPPGRSCLIDVHELTGLMVRYKIGTRVLATIEVQGLDEGFFLS